MVGVIGLINGFGRIAWSSVSDYIGRRNTYILFFLIEIFAFYALANTTEAFFFQLLVLIIVSCYGGGFSCMPAYLSDLFGTKQLSAIHAEFSQLGAWLVSQDHFYYPLFVKQLKVMHFASMYSHFYLLSASS